MEDGTATGVGGDSSSHTSPVQMVLAVFIGTVVGLSGLAAISLWATAFILVLGPNTIGPMEELAVSTLSLGLGTGTVAALFMAGRGYGLSHLDFKLPDVSGFVYVIVGTIALLALQIVAGIVMTQFGISTAEHSIQQQASQGNPEILLLLIPAALLIIGPGEELLYRNIIQKSLYDTFSKRNAVVIASVIFALAHIPAYAMGSTLMGTAATLVIIFLLALLLGTIYLKTGNVTVPALIHGSYDAVLFGLMYLQITGQL
ncbi:CPBP family intramembrane glutamic endopeptidase [Haladaptatus cibarius]|uniref:CPBP family intramembrane glutamic endopeptidase n=1 Tax=Haladaptatus cibarius TaxID=453847 RepID=UPI0006795B8E|nr:type II CAAX endopeptidase family protein [Haladaptatus cibarius]